MLKDLTNNEYHAKKILFFDGLMVISNSQNKYPLSYKIYATFISFSLIKTLGMFEMVSEYSFNLHLSYELGPAFCHT